MLTQLAFNFLMPQSSLVIEPNSILTQEIRDEWFERMKREAQGVTEDDLCLLQVLKDTGGYAYSHPRTDSHSAFLRLARAGWVKIEQSDDQSRVEWMGGPDPV